MTSDSRAAVLRRHRSSLLVALLVASESVGETLFKIRVIETLLTTWSLRGEGLSREAIDILVEEHAGLLPRSRIWPLIESTRLLRERGGRYVLRDTLPLTDFMTEAERRPRRLRRRELRSSPLHEVEWTLDGITAVFFPVEGVAWTVRTVRSAISRGYGWFLRTLEFGHNPDNRLSSLPAFWSCGPDGDSPVGTLRAVTSVGDTVASLTDRAWIGSQEATAVRVPWDYALTQLLDCATERSSDPAAGEPLPEHDAGGFLPYDDQPEAAHPTVDATWDAVLALANVYGRYDDLPLGRADKRLSRSALAGILVGAVEFLLRMQLQRGGWGIYRFPSDEPRVSASAFTTAQTIVALCRVLGTTAFEDGGAPELRLRVETALLAAFEFVKAHAVHLDGALAWAPFFDTGTDVGAASTRDLLRESVWTGTGLLALYRYVGHLRPMIAPLLGELVSLADRYWTLNYSAAADFEFRVPLRDRLHDTFAKWSNRYDVTVALLLLDLYNGACSGDGPEVQLSDGLWDRLEHTIGNVLKEQHPDHGHWGEPIEGLPLAAATAMAIQTLQQYLVAAGHLVRQPDVAPAQV